MQDARVSGASSQYFLGSIVLIKNNRGPKSSVVASTDKLEDSRLRYRENATLLLEKAKALPSTELLLCGSSSPTIARWLSSPRPTSKPRTA